MAAASMVQAMGPSVIPDLIERSWDMYSTDLTPEELLTLAAAIIRVDPAKTTNVVAAGRRAVQVEPVWSSYKTPPTRLSKTCRTGISEQAESPPH